VAGICSKLKTLMISVVSNLRSFLIDLYSPFKKVLMQCLLVSTINTDYRGYTQRCSLGLERLGLEAVWRFCGTSRSRLGLVDITSRSRVSGFETLGLVNIHAMHLACGYIRKKINDLTRKKQVVK